MIETFDEMRIIRGMNKSKKDSIQRKDLLFKHVITDLRSSSLMNAYRLKSDIIKKLPEEDKPKIISTEPIIIIPEKKFEHTKGALITPIMLSKRQQEVIVFYHSKKRSLVFTLLLINRLKN